ncbi:MAG: hypothetical protein RBR74_05545 [Ignavibacteriaceae bacterium]|jgi:hypothetical protein|nr:hypothetical protein [Ignavibacteriaceae bacterium]
MKKTLQIINQLVEQNVITEYAIAGGMAQFYYIEPSATYDLDLIVSIKDEPNSLTPPAALYEWADKNNFPTEFEHIIIGGIPVQFLLAYNDLVKEALINKIPVTLFDEPAFLFSAEYLMAIMLQTGRPIDFERLTRFITEAEFNEFKLIDILERNGLSEKYNDFIKRINE